MSSGPGNSGGAEQRRFARVPIKLDGLLSIAGQTPVPCSVRDFCVGGMFMTADPGAYASVKPQTPAVLYFALMVDGEKQDYQVKLIIARAVAKGLGVSFVDPESHTLALLSQLAAPDGMPSLPESAADMGRSQEGFAPEFAALEGPLKALTNEHVTEMCEKFLDRVDEALFLAGRDADNNVDQNHFLDGQRELRGRKKKVLQEVPSKIALGISILGNPLSDRERDAASLSLSDLSLIEKDEFEEFLVVSEIVAELEPLYSEALFTVGRRLTYLANREIDNSALPIGPNVLCNAMSDALKGLQSHQKVVARVYQVVGEVLSEQLGAFYDAVNAVLIEQGILPVIDPDKPVIRRQPSANVGFDAPHEGAVADDDALADLMPGPENYQGRPSAPDRGPAPRSTQAAPPGYPAGNVQAVPPSHPPAGNVQAVPPSHPTGGVQAAPPSHPTGNVQAAPPSYPTGGVQAAPPSYPTGGVQAAPPSYPTGNVQAAPPGYSAGGVQAAPPSYPAGGVQAAPPGDPAGGVQAAPPSVTGGQPSAPAAGVSGANFRGWTGPAVHYVQPSMQQAYSAAQAQLALRRNLTPDLFPGASETTRQRGEYTTNQIVEGLADLQHDYAQTSSAELLDADLIKQRIVQALINDGAPEKLVGGGAYDAIEVVANLFSALLQDSMVAKNAKSQLTRLQPAVHRAALVDDEFFESTDHPVRRVVNRISRLRDGSSESQKQRNVAVDELVTKVNREFRDDIGVFETVVAQLDEIIEEQEAEHRKKVASIVESCEQQQQLLEARRGQSLEATDSGGDRSDLPEEWNKWLDRSRKLEVGQRVMMNATTPRATAMTLVWKEARNNLFVFVDDQGNKANPLTLQQVAMNLRRGIIVILGEEEQPALERAMAGVVERFHTQVEAQATRDALTGFLLGKFFASEIDAALPDAEAASSRDAVVCHLAIENLRDINDKGGASAGDAMLKAVAAELQRSIRGKDVVFGRLEGAALGIYWPTAGIEAAYKKMQSVMQTLVEVELEPSAVGSDDDATVDFSKSASEAATVARPLKPELIAGITGSGDNLVQAEGLLGAAREACDTARGMGVGSIYVSGSETEQRRQMEQMIAYADQALDNDRLILSAHHVTSLSEADLAPALYIAVSARDRNGKAMPSQLFAPALARSANAAEIDLWAFRTTLGWIAEHEEEAEAFALVIVPLSAASSRNEDLPNLIMSEFMETPVPPGRICFALSDHDVVENIIEVGELISTLKEFGCRFVLDEFGSGHENYDYIKTVDVDFVTVKTGFISDAQKNPKDFAMAKSINELVHFMGKKTIAKQAAGLDLAPTMREIGIDFLYDLTDRLQLAPDAAP